MFAWLFGHKCAMCGKKKPAMRIYYNDQGKRIHICENCVPYAERRAYRKRR